MSVKHSILSLLFRQPMHGYELGKQLAAATAIEWGVKPAQIASTLTRLSEGAQPLVAFAIAPGDDAPDRKVYRLTSAGESELREWFLQPEVRDYQLSNAFYLKLVFSLRGGPVAPEQVLQSQRRELYQELHQVTELRRATDPATNLPLSLLLDSATMHLDADIRWIEMVEARLPDLKRHTPPPLPPRPRGRPRRQEAGISVHEAGAMSLVQTGEDDRV